MDQPATLAPDLLTATTDIVAAFVGHNALPQADLASLIASVHDALTRLGEPATPPAPTYAPVVPVKRSITPDHLVSLIDGKSYRTLKRHLTRHGLTPDEYRARYGLPRDYPMTAASYSAVRSERAKANGLGQQGRSAAAPTSEPKAKAPKKRGRTSKKTASE